MLNLREVGAEWLEPFFDGSVNTGLSGGERKKVELLALCILRPRRVVVLDELDSGLDVDAVAAFRLVLGKLKRINPGLAWLVISHHAPLLTPEKVHVLISGRIVSTGGPSLLVKVQNRGFQGF